MMWFERIFFSRDWLVRNHCAKGTHWFRWWFWRDGVTYRVPGGGNSPALTGWETTCEVCRSASIVDVQAPAPEPRRGLLGKLLPVRKWRKFTG